MGKTSNKSQVMELKDLISCPLVATIDADTISSSRYLKYLLEVAFESYDSKTGKTGKMRTLCFTYYSQDINGSHKQTVSIPLLTLVPLPLLQVKEAEFDFDINVLDAISEDTESSFSIKNAVKGTEDDKEKNQETKLRVSLTPSSANVNNKETSQQSISANMRIKVKMRPADLPGGIANLLNLTTNNLLIEEVKEDRNI